MSATLATALLLSVYALVLAPIAIAYWRPRMVLPVGWSYAVMILGIIIYQAGVLPQSPPMTLRTGMFDSAHTSSRRCAEIMDLLERQHVILNKADPARLVVNQELWSQLPQEARDAIVECAEAARPAAVRGNSMEVVEQPAR